MIPTDPNDWPGRIAILGVGLLGGSVALSIRRVRPQCHFVGYSRSIAKLDAAVESGLIESAKDTIAKACEDCDVVVVAAPVDRIARMVIEAAEASPANCLITDVGSTKAGIVRSVEANRTAASKFVAAHPIAGSEKSGFEHATASLFDRKVVVLTPGVAAVREMIGRADRFWKLTGGVTRTMSPADHDAHLAAISHVPHLVSALVARMVPPAARSLVGSGWNDITRVAAGDPEMWAAICRENRTAISLELERVSDELRKLSKLIDDHDDVGLASWLSDAKAIRDHKQH